MTPKANNLCTQSRFWLNAQFAHKSAEDYFHSINGFDLWIFMEQEDGWDGATRPFKTGRSRSVSFGKSERRYSLSYYFGRSEWVDKSQSEFNIDLKCAVVLCFNAMFDRAFKNGDIKDAGKFRNDFDDVMSRFLADAPMHPYVKTEIWESDRYSELKRQGKL
jgi:hypothetical protein